MAGRRGSSRTEGPSSVGGLQVPMRGLYTTAVPVYEYACMECEEHFDELVRSEARWSPAPSCGAGKVLKQFSTFAVHGSAPSRASPSGAGGGGGCCGGGCGCH